MNSEKNLREISVDAVAVAICDAFWETAEVPDRWSSMSQQKRQVFRNCARAALRVMQETGEP